MLWSAIPMTTRRLFTTNWQRLGDACHSNLATGINAVLGQALSQLSPSLPGYPSQCLCLGSQQAGDIEESGVATMNPCQLFASLVMSMCCHILSTTAWYIFYNIFKTSHLIIWYSIYFITVILTTNLSIFFLLLSSRSVNNFLMTGPKVI